MALDLFCYSSDPVLDVSLTVEKIRNNNSEIFDEKFYISKVGRSERLPEETFVGDGLIPCSLFLVSLNDKDAFQLLGDVENIIKENFKKGTILILLNNEILR